jgi:hypothetical protein
VAVAVVISDGQLAAAKATLHTAAGDEMLKVVLVNTDSSARTVNVYVKPGATSRLISPENLSLGAGEQWTSEVVGVKNGDLIEGDASVANVVDFIVTGVQKT